MDDMRLIVSCFSSGKHDSIADHPLITGRPAVAGRPAISPGTLAAGEGWCECMLALLRGPREVTPGLRLN